MAKFELKEKTRLLGKCAATQPVKMLLTSSGEKAARLQRPWVIPGQGRAGGLSRGPGADSRYHPAGVSLDS